MEGKRNALVFAVTICFVLLGEFRTFAGAPVVTETAGEGLLIQFSPFTEEHGEPALPPEFYEWRGEAYERVSSRLVAVMTDEVKRTEKKIVTYSHVEQLDHVPEETVITVMNEETGATVREVLPACAVNFREGRWIDDFQFPITVENYEAGVYELLGTTIICGEEEPFSGYEELLLELIGASPEYYEIQSVSWISEPEEDGEGGWIRRAMAAGRKYVADCQVTYEGTVIFPPVPALAYEAEYRKIMETQAVSVQGAEEEESQASSLKAESGGRRHIFVLTTVTVSLLWVLFLIWLFHRRKKKRQR